tara:strand:+ start:938 stop:1270 length:333 start_codon:yes stop_codon:yes gene_type:complete
MLDFTIDLPTDEIENLFINCDDDHMAIPSHALGYNKRKSYIENNHDEMLDFIIDKKLPSQNIKNWVSGMRHNGRQVRREKIMRRRAKYAHRDNPTHNCLNMRELQQLINQ